ncbi:MAG: hypothetical protein K9J16_05415 [Melioribacteraceae bacterium]|nr:hypothetical protein [Melioribacteraceae bacterium]MCF8354399.1 hypothetical protein [Melioribacteraceae bacterium]MCF8393004.1 hypothetical protein [Melioribacteraceae bacterium]MCF8417253.1 hypothetical protein [Melioribacteraceae bacterium]
MKTAKFYIASLMLLFLTANLNAKSISFKTNVELDSVNLLAEFSLFYEYYKNNDYKSAINHGWIVLNTDPSNFLQYKPFKKMEEILWAMHDSVAENEDQKKAFADTTLYLYDLALKYQTDKKGYFLSRKAYIEEIWFDYEPEIPIKTYEEAIETDNGLSTFYKDRLGQLYAKNATEENDYKLKALTLYSKLQEEEPNNETWISRIESLAEDLSELVDITKKAWDLDKENTEKAWKYASLCLRAQELEKAIGPLEWLVSKSPEVINYHRQLATTYDKLEQSDKAIESYKTLIELEPENRENYINIALIYKRNNQLSVSRSYLQKARDVDSSWEYPVFIEAQLYEQAGRNCVGAKFEFMDKCVYQLAVNTYRKAASMGGPYSSAAAERVNLLSNSVPSQEDYFFRKMKSGQEIKIEGECYSWINRSIIVP